MSQAGRPSGRRSPRPAERQRDAERSREALLDAALAEFAAHGYAAARVSDIAERAGVNKQLISYYFGGKEGLYQALVERWLRVEAGMTRSDMPIEDVVAAYVDLIRAQPDLTRLFLWEALAYTPGGPGPDEPGAAAEVVDIARRQHAGELPPELDPAYALLFLMALSIGPQALAAQVKQFTGLEPDSAEFLERYREQIRLLIRRLGPPTTQPPPGGSQEDG